VNDKTRKPLPAWLVLVVGAFLVLQFVGLGLWQISRGLEKRATQHAYQGETGFAMWQDGMAVRSFQRLQVAGSYDGEHQLVLDNIILNNRYGQYIVTPLEIAAGRPLLLVNRGWIETASDGFDVDRLDLPDGYLTVRGRAGSLPRAGYKMKAAIEAEQDWPKHAVYPSLEEVAAALGREVQPFVLLMDPREDRGFVRYWVPSEFGPGKHFAYALQWFAMGGVLSGLLIWNYRKKRFDT